MPLETATYIANLVVTNPDGGDQANTLEDHIKLVKAASVRTFPKMDGAVSLSAAQVMYLNDVSASVQLQLNQLRDGSATANNALYANSASVAANVGSIPAARVMDLNATNVMTATEPLRFGASGAFITWYVSGVLQGSIQYDGAGMQVSVANTSHIYRISMNGSDRFTINPDGTLTIPGLITGTITTAQTASTAATANSASYAALAGTATNATFAATCTSASSAATLGGLSPASGFGTPSSVVTRDSAGDVYARYFNQHSGQDNQSVGHVATMTNLDGFWRPSTVANLGAYLEARNITGRTGIAKTLSTSTPSGGSNGDIWYRY